MANYEMTEREFGRREFFTELGKKAGLAALGALMGSALVKLDELPLRPANTPAVWLGSDGDYAGV